MAPVSDERADHRRGTALAAVICVLLTFGAGGASGCKKKEIIGNPEEAGKLTRIAEGLEDAFGTKPLPAVYEPANLGERLARWDNFRQCAVQTYVARRREADEAAKHGEKRPSHHASIGAETVEECAVQAAIVNQEPSYCERLQVDYAGPNGEPTLPALRCWDTMARVLGQPERCPLIWLAGDGFGRNPECLAMASRDESFCWFAENPPRCRALVRDDDEPCGHAEASGDCKPAVAYWRGFVEKGTERGKPLFADKLFAPDRGENEGLFLRLRFLSDQDGHGRVQFSVPASHLGISWAGGGSTPAAPASSKLWGAAFPVGATHITSRSADFSMKLTFHAAGLEGQLPLQPPGRDSAATLIMIPAVKAPGPGGADTTTGTRRCWPASETRGQVSYRMLGTGPGALVEGQVQADKITCDDGTTASVKGDFRVAVLDVR